MDSLSHIISTILKHDAKVKSYKIALLRAINDVVLAFPDIRTYDADVAIPLRMLAEFWIAYYWPFVDPTTPILQGARALRQGQWSNDMAFRPELTVFRLTWEASLGSVAQPADGYWLINELRVSRRRDLYSSELVQAYQQAIKAVCKTLEMPIRYAGPSSTEWGVFRKPVRYSKLGNRAVPLPGTQPNDICLVIQAELWHTFLELSLWIEALCIHEWCLFTERVAQVDGGYIERGQIYTLLTARPDNRRPLNWERNHVDLLLMEGREFICPWTERHIRNGTAYDLDHLIPVSVYPINELWNLVPADPRFNSHVKRDRLPSVQSLTRAEPRLVVAYSNYGCSKELAAAIQEDVAIRFATVPTESASPESIALVVVDFIDQFAQARHLTRFE